MSMRDPLFGDYPIPADTYRAAHAAHPNGTRALQLREHFGEARISGGSSCQERQDLTLLPVALPATVEHQRPQRR